MPHEWCMSPTYWPKLNEHECHELMRADTRVKGALLVWPQTWKFGLSIVYNSNPSWLRNNIVLEISDVCNHHRRWKLTECKTRKTINRKAKILCHLRLSSHLFILWAKHRKWNCLRSSWEISWILHISVDRRELGGTTVHSQAAAAEFH